MAYAQDGSATALEKIAGGLRAPIIEPFVTKSTGVAKKIDAELTGRASVLLGAGRQKTGDAIDFAVGFSAVKKTGEHVDLDEPLHRAPAVALLQSVVNHVPRLQHSLWNFRTIFFNKIRPAVVMNKFNRMHGVDSIVTALVRVNRK
jgi:thymidine phosphorylase